MNVSSRGSSPLTRGKLPDVNSLGPHLGLIPAHAGKTYTSQKLGIILTAHPRSRGENLAHTTRGEYFKGSSPLTRGKLAIDEILGLDAGLIPAHAGKTPLGSARSKRPMAHPRSRGENYRVFVSGRRTAGSSPLTRGKPRWALGAAHGGGLIPAHAGKTVRAASAAPTAGAHPRSRGENHTAPRGPRTPVGSSPLTRGKRFGAGVGAGAGGLIPAHAGKTLYACRPSWHARAHPRSRGENPVRSSRFRYERGSSPLTRGKPVRDERVNNGTGLIPAHAGKTHHPDRVGNERWAHPRSRGENL